MNAGFDLSSGLESIRPWLTTAFIGSILALVAKLYVDNRRLKLTEKSRSQNFQLQMSADGRSNLQFIIDNLVRDIEAQRHATQAQATAHGKCQEELDAIREEHRAQSRQLEGLCRQFIAFSESVGRAIPPGTWSPEITAMMGQLDALAEAARNGRDQIE